MGGGLQKVIDCFGKGNPFPSSHPHRLIARRNHCIVGGVIDSKALAKTIIVLRPNPIYLDTPCRSC